MEKKFKGLPLFDAVLTDENLGIFRVSLVDAPATEITWLAFSKKAEPLKFSVTNEEQHRVLSVIMLADTPIYRVNEKGEGYYIQFSKETLYEAARRLLLNGFQNYVNVEHIDGSSVYGFEMTQIFQKDAARGINPAGFEEVPDGTLFGEYYVADETLWQEIRQGRFVGLSLEGEFTLAEEDINSVDELIRYLGIE